MGRRQTSQERARAVPFECPLPDSRVRSAHGANSPQSDNGLIRRHMAEFGLAAAIGREGLDKLVEVILDGVEPLQTDRGEAEFFGEDRACRETVTNLYGN